jgi:hypothetical protein
LFPAINPLILLNCAVMRKVELNMLRLAPIIYKSTIRKTVLAVTKIPNLMFRDKGLFMVSIQKIVLLFGHSSVSDRCKCPPHNFYRQ